MGARNSLPRHVERCNPTRYNSIFYQYIKEGKISFLPIVAMVNNQLTSARGMALPKEVLMFNLRDNSAVNSHFKNIYSNIDNQCISVGEGKGSSLSNNCQTPDLLPQSYFLLIFSLFAREKAVSSASKQRSLTPANRANPEKTKTEQRPAILINWLPSVTCKMKHNIGALSNINMT